MINHFNFKKNLSSPLCLPLCFLFILLLLSLSCKRASSSFPATYEQKAYCFLNSTAAASYIIQDTVNHYFEKVNIMDMCLQMKTELNNPHNNTKKILEEYKLFLKKEVLDFTSEERQKVGEVMDEIYKEIRNLNPAIDLDSIFLIKSRATQYGPGAYYTRERNIIIPQSMLNQFDRPSFKETMIHEIFHILSRYDPKWRKELYELIGFQALRKEEILNFPAALKERLLLNPDGINMAYRVDLSEEGDTNKYFIPILKSNCSCNKARKKSYFDCMDFELYPIEERSTNRIEIMTNEKGESTISAREMAVFYYKIGNNTNYIIHPDEIMADNFILLLEIKRTPMSLHRLNAKGQNLIKSMERIMSFKQEKGKNNL